MKNLFTLLFFFILVFSLDSFAGTCSSISRTNNAANGILTSTKYNLDNNTAYTAINAADGGCISTGTLEKDALNTTDFQTVQSAPKTGCGLIYQSASTVRVAPCRIAIDNDYTVTSTGSTVAFGCSGCSGEVGTTDYYVYATTSSATSSLDLLISTSVPDDNGYSGTNRALGKFHNSTGSDIIPVSIMNWEETGFKGNVPAGLYGSIRWLSTTNCNWSGTSGTFAGFSADLDCDDNGRIKYGAAVHTTVETAGHSDGSLPQIKFSSMPAGHYYVVANGAFDSIGTDNRCGFRFSDGSGFTVETSMSHGGTGHTGYTGFAGSFTYTTTKTNVTIQIQHGKFDGTSCDIIPDSTRELEIAVYR